MARQVADAGVAALSLRSLWGELGIRDIEEQDLSRSECSEALRSVCDVSQIPDLEPPLIRNLGP